MFSLCNAMFGTYKAILGTYGAIFATSDAIFPPNKAMEVTYIAMFPLKIATYRTYMGCFMALFFS